MWRGAGRSICKQGRTDRPLMEKDMEGMRWAGLINVGNSSLVRASTLVSLLG